MSQVSITIGMSEDLMNALKARALEMGISRNALIKEGVSRVLNDRWFSVTPEAYAVIRGLAADRGMPPTALIREWVSQMIEVNHASDR